MTSLISESYRALNAHLHRSNESYGTSGHKWAKSVDALATGLPAWTVLDYGCGRGTLKQALYGSEVDWPRPYSLFEYDPAVEGKDAHAPVDLVVCTDVLEHIEPECLDAVLDDIRALSVKAAFLTVSMRPARKTLADGRNAHLIQESVKWWLPKLMERWELKNFQDFGGKFGAVLTV